MRNARAHKLQWSGSTVHSSTVHSSTVVTLLSDPTVHSLYCDFVHPIFSSLNVHNTPLKLSKRIVIKLLLKRLSNRITLGDKRLDPLHV